MTLRDALDRQLELDLGRCGYTEEGPDGLMRECILRRHRGRHVLLSMGYIAGPVSTVKLRGEVL